jgi:hypothetical protein
LAVGAGEASRGEMHSTVSPSLEESGLPCAACR